MPVDHPDFDPGILGYANGVHNDYVRCATFSICTRVANQKIPLASTSQTDNSGPGRAFELLTANVRSWNPKPTISGEEADELLSRRVIGNHRH